MNLKKYHAFVRTLALAALGICFSAGMLSAEQWSATFSLSTETQWGPMVLPAGEYSFLLDTLPNPSFQPIVILRQGTRGIGMAMPAFGVHSKSPDPSHLLVVRDGNKATVISLYVESMGTEFRFNAPKEYEVYHRLITQGSRPPAVEVIPVFAAGK